MKDKIIFKGKLKPSKTNVGTVFQSRYFKDKFGSINKGESRCCHIDTEWGQLSIPNYKDLNKYGNKEIEIIVKLSASSKEKKKNE